MGKASKIYLAGALITPLITFNILPRRDHSFGYDNGDRSRRYYNFVCEIAQLAMDGAAWPVTLPAALLSLRSDK